MKNLEKNYWFIDRKVHSERKSKQRAESLNTKIFQDLSTVEKLVWVTEILHIHYYTCENQQMEFTRI